MKGISFAILTILLMVTGLRAAEVEVLKPKGNLEIEAWPSIDDFAL